MWLSGFLVDQWQTSLCQVKGHFLLRAHGFVYIGIITWLHWLCSWICCCTFVSHDKVELSVPNRCATFVSHDKVELSVPNRCATCVPQCAMGLQLLYQVWEINTPVANQFSWQYQTGVPYQFTLTILTPERCGTKVRHTCGTSMACLAV